MIFPAISDGDKVPERVREFLDKLDPFDPVNRNDDVMSQRIQELVERTAALSRSRIDQGEISVGNNEPEEPRLQVPATPGVSHPLQKVRRPQTLRGDAVYDFLI